MNDTAKDQVVQAGFEQRRVFDALREHDVMHHGTVYELLRRIFVEYKDGFDLLDVGCGDGRHMAAALHWSRVSSYVGMDNSREAVDAARINLSSLPCPVSIVDDDWQGVMDLPDESVDIIWMGLFLHHLPQEMKVTFLTRARRILKPNGVVLAHDPLPKPGESREQYIDRLEAHGRKRWDFLFPEDFGMLRQHWSGHGHQESYPALRDLGVSAGFSRTELLWMDEDAFYGLVGFYSG
jgi:SAM-dependent methyltransferase